MNVEPASQPVQPLNLQARFSKGDRVEVEIIDAAEAEKCFGRLPDGVGVFVRGLAAIGDRVEGAVSKIKPRYLEARLQRVVRASPHRVQPICPHFGVCGGCKWQHVSYEEQLRIKRKQVEDALTHLGGFRQPEVHSVIPAEMPFGYRNKVDFTFGNRRFLLTEEAELPPEDRTKPSDFAVGFHAPFQYAKVLDIDYCFLATPEMNRVLEIVRAFAREQGWSIYDTRSHQGYLRNLVVRQSEATGQVMVNLVTSSYEPERMENLAHGLEAGLRDRLGTFLNHVTQRKSQVAMGEAEHVIRGPGRIVERLADLEYAVSANSFFQTHTRQACTLVDQVVSLADLQESDTAYDLYCGAGSMSLPLARRCSRLLGIDLMESAITDATANADRNRIENCTFRTMDMKDLRKTLDEWRAWGVPDVVVTDPPRDGMHPKAVQALLELAPRRMVYVSCKPASFARDAQLLCGSDAYRLGAVQPVDMFPQTNHIECVALLVRP
jgi:23S rRNA (uracil1939-C5)-methyltransferase